MPLGRPLSHHYHGHLFWPGRLPTEANFKFANLSKVTWHPGTLLDRAKYLEYAYLLPTHYTRRLNDAKSLDFEAVKELFNKIANPAAGSRTDIFPVEIQKKGFSEWIDTMKEDRKKSEAVPEDWDTPAKKQQEKECEKNIHDYRTDQKREEIENFVFRKHGIFMSRFRWLKLDAAPAPDAKVDNGFHDIPKNLKAFVEVMLSLTDININSTVGVCSPAVYNDLSEKKKKDYTTDGLKKLSLYEYYELSKEKKAAFDEETVDHVDTPNSTIVTGDFVLLIKDEEEAKRLFKKFDGAELGVRWRDCMKDMLGQKFEVMDMPPFPGAVRVNESRGAADRRITNLIFPKSMLLQIKREDVDNDRFNDRFPPGTKVKLVGLENAALNGKGGVVVEGKRSRGGAVLGRLNVLVDGAKTSTEYSHKNLVDDEKEEEEDDVQKQVMLVATHADSKDINDAMKEYSRKKGQGKASWYFNKGYSSISGLVSGVVCAGIGAGAAVESGIGGAIGAGAGLVIGAGLFDVARAQLYAFGVSAFICATHKAQFEYCIAELERLRVFEVNGDTWIEYIETWEALYDYWTVLRNETKEQRNQVLISALSVILKESEGDANAVGDMHWEDTAYVWKGPGDTLAAVRKVRVCFSRGPPSIGMIEALHNMGKMLTTAKYPGLIRSLRYELYNIETIVAAKARVSNLARDTVLSGLIAGAGLVGQWLYDDHFNAPNVMEVLNGTIYG
jgi:hypothetical protein